MTKELFHSIHPNFKWNAFHLNRKQLLEIAEEYSKSNEDFLKETGLFLLNWFDDNDFVIVQTSGTTGKPKRLHVKKQAMVNSALASAVFFGLSEGNSALCCLPVKYIAGKMMLVRALVLGLEIDLVEPKSNPMDNNEKYYDFVAMVPLQVENSLDKLDQIKQLIIGGAKVHSDLADKLKTKKCEAYETYSMTETVTHIAAKRVGVEAFTVLPDVKISLDNRDCLVIDAPKLNPDLIITNDIASIVSPTEFIWKGRVDNVINSGGIKLFPETIEEKIYERMSNRFFIDSFPDKQLGEKVVLIVEGVENKLEESVFDTLDKYERPKVVFYVAKFLETETGKIKRKEIVQQLLIKNPA
ncbi:AMP-binding protein [Flavobacterium sp. GCM10027622]|uniref:AMP-binding protein n=1 Tax=unclassified Flavobacterium TaxID=196869 RepID=UPI00361B70BD